MMIADVIRQAKTEHEIYLLVTAYLETMEFGGKNAFVSQSTTLLPLAGKEDLQKRFDQLFIDLDNASKALDDHACLTMKEALHIFGSALHQLHHLELLEGAKNYSPFANQANQRDPKITGRQKMMHSHPDRTHSHSAPQAGDGNRPVITH